MLVNIIEGNSQVLAFDLPAARSFERLDHFLHGLTGLCDATDQPVELG